MTTTSFFTDRMHLTDDGVALYVDAIKLKRTAELPEEMLHHVEHCIDCQMQIVELNETLKGEVYDIHAKHPYFDAVREPQARYGILAYRIAAVLAGAALLGVGYYFITSNNSLPATPVIVEKDTPTQTKQQQEHKGTQEITVKKTSQDFAANFTESPNMEDLVQTQFRSVSVEVITPKAGDIVKQPVVFRWKGVNEPLTLKILSNKERVVASAQSLTDSYTAAKTLSPGLYYWKLETKNELVYAGKFLVK
jgi:hypothetical protein